MATLTGKITDVTSKTPESISQITVKAPSARIGSGTDVIVSSPATVDFNRATGDITISNLTGGLSWLYIEGDGWTDSIALSVAEGMITLVEAVANAAGAPGLADYIRLLAELETRIDGIAQDAVDEAAENIRWFKGFIDDTHATMADVPIGLWGISAQTHAVRLGLPADFGTLQVMTMGSSRAAFFIGRSSGLYINMSQDDVWGEWHQPWAKDKWFKGAITNDHETMADVGVGVWNIAARNHAVRLGLPMDYGSLQVMQIGLSKTAFFIGQTTGFWINSSNGDVWGEWERPMGSGGSGGGGSTGGLKTVGMALTGGSLLDGTAGRYRILSQVTAPVVRWRVHVESHRMLSNTTSAFTLGNVYVGKHTSNGAILNATQINTGSSTIPAGGEWISRWMDEDLSDEYLIDVDVSGTELYWYQAAGWKLEGGTWVASKNSPVSIWLEVETYADTPVVALIGDSTGVGQGADRPVHESALHIAARKHRFIPMLYAYPGSSMQSINDYGFHLFQRWAHLDKPDSVIIQSGSNDIHTGASTTELQTRFTDLVETAKLISPVVIGATVKARYPDSGEFATALTAHNTYVKALTNGNRDYLDFYASLSPNGTVAAEDAADAAHLTTSGHTKLASAFDDVTVARPEVTALMAEKVNMSELAAVEARLAPLEPKAASASGDTEWAHVTDDGTRLPLGYGADGRLDAHARKIFAEDAAGIFTDSNSEYSYVKTTPDGDVLFAVKQDGETIIPGLQIPQPSSNSGGAYHFTNGHAEPVETDLTRWAGWGSSTLQLMSQGLSQVASRHGAQYHDRAKGGERGEGTIARLGSRPLRVTFPDGVIPASGAVTVSVADFTEFGSMSPFDVTISGIAGTMVWDNSAKTWTFTRSSTGTAVDVEANVLALPVHDLAGAFTILNIGKNSLVSSSSQADVDRVCEWTDEAFQYLTPLHKKALVMGHFGTDTTDNRNVWYRRVNERLAQTYGAIYVDIDAFVMGEAIWAATGITPTQADLDAQSDGRLAPSLQQDAAHLNAAASIAAAELVESHAQNLNWI